MNIDDVGRRAGHDLQRASNRLEPSLPAAPDLVQSGRRRRTRRIAVGAGVILVLLAGSGAFAAVDSGGGSGRTRVATDGDSTVPSSDKDPSSTSTTDAGNAASTAESCPAINGTEPDRSHCATAPNPDPSGGNDSTPTPTAVPVPPDNPTTTTIPGPSSTGLGRVSGHVRAGPTCPVETPDQQCDDVGIVATITFTMIRDDAELLYERTVTSGPDGSYSIDLAPGHFSVTVTSDAAMSCTDTTVTVIDGNAATLDLSCDTGIR